MTHEQRKRFWAMLGDISAQVPWPVNNVMGHLDKEDWRLIFAAAYTQEKRVAAGINGGQVILGLRLRDILKGADDEEGKRIASELIELVSAFGAQRGVQWTDPKLAREA